MIIKKYWQLAESFLPAGYLPFEQDLLSGPPDFLRRLKAAEGVVIGRWDQDNLIGHVLALGVCLGITEEGARIDWREVDIHLKPNPSGRIHWSSKSYFGFADSVVERYGLVDLFSERFPDLESSPVSTPGLAPEVRRGIARRLPAIATPGYVYVIRSQYGFKIGKTVNIKSRTKLFSVKLPFPISVEHYAKFDDYSKAERDFHKEFHAKRLEGEWFNLSPEDLTKIKSRGISATPQELHSL